MAALLFWEQDVAGSNPATSTKRRRGGMADTAGLSPAAFSVWVQVPSAAPLYMLGWRNRQTHRTQNATEKSMRVQVPHQAPETPVRYAHVCAV